VIHRIAHLDIPGRLSGVAPHWAAKSACALLGIGLAVVLRALTNLVAPGVAPYAFVYPAALLATLLGGWQAGAGTLAISALLAWMFVVPKAALSGGQMHYQMAAAVIAASTAGLMIVVGEGFRAASRHLMAERTAKLAERELLFRELQHRVGNDFAVVSSLLDLQRRRSNNPETRAALEQAMGRIQSISRVHRQIYALPDAGGVDLRLYLKDLCQGLRDAALPAAGVTLNYICDEAYMSRDHALALGLATNELVTNAIKHAFPDDLDGSVTVAFARADEGWCLVVRDDGIGMAPLQRKAGLGTGLVEQFVRQVGGELQIGGSRGTTVTIILPPEIASATVH
jgi:two-component sensor histidine kinase